MCNLNIYEKLLGRIVAVSMIVWALYQGYTEWYNHNWRYVTPTDKQIQQYSVSPKQALALYQLMKDTHEILTQNNIDYWIESGTLLGAIRHKGLIPFDDDLDIAIQHQDEIRLQRTFDSFRKLNYEVKQDRFYSICGIVCIDIFVSHLIDDKFLYSNLKTRQIFATSYFYSKELFPLKKYNFGPLEIYGPREYKPYLDRQFPEWDKYAIIKQPHNYHYRLSGIEKKTKFILTPKLLEPLLPDASLQDRIPVVVGDMP